MRKFMLFFVVMVAMLGVCSPATAQGGDISLWAKMANRAGGPELIPWITYDTGEFFFETRSNFDWKDTFTLFVGKSFRTAEDSVTIIPELGMIWGEDYKSVTTQVLAFGTFADRFCWVGMQQFSLGDGTSPDFMYHWIEVLYRAWTPKPRSALKLGVSEQVYWEFGTNGAEALLDIGPVVRAEFSNGFYVKLWGTIDPSHHETKKLFVGVGHLF